LSVLSEKMKEILIILSEVLGISIEELERFDKTDSLKALGLTSLKTMELVVRLEENMGIEIDDEDLNFEKFNSIQLLNDLIGKYTNQTKG
jgi:acyl carrier protein